MDEFDISILEFLHRIESATALQVAATVLGVADGSRSWWHLRRLIKQGYVEAKPCNAYQLGYSITRTGIAFLMA